MYLAIFLEKQLEGLTSLQLTYGALGPTTVMWNGTTYYYALNVQGDVIGILDENGAVVVTYFCENAWGYNPTPEGPLASTLGTLNPLRYRSYVYDPKTGYYYLQSRYYDPQIGRFINADTYVSTGQGFIGNNMFAYCLNNPVNATDDDGHSSDDLAGWIGELIGTLIYEWVTGDDHPQQQIDELEVQVIQKQNQIIADAADAVWDAYVHSNELQAQAQYEQDMAVKSFWEDTFSSTTRTWDFVNMTANNVLTYSGYVAFAAQPTVATAVTLVIGVGSCIYSTLRHFGIITE